MFQIGKCYKMTNSGFLPVHSESIRNYHIIGLGEWGKLRIGVIHISTGYFEKDETMWNLTNQYLSWEPEEMSIAEWALARMKNVPSW